MSSPAANSLRTLAVKSAVWYGATRLWGQLVSWGVTILLARLLVPSDYGLFAIALSALALLELLQEFGLETALIQSPEQLTRRQINAVFWLITSCSLLLSVSTALAAGSISAISGEPRLTWVLRALCLTFLLNSFGSVPYSLLTKALDLRRRSLAEAFGTAASAILALSLAYLGYGVWALVLAHLARALVLNSSLALFARWLPGLDADFRAIRGLVSFGLGVAGTQFVGTTTNAANTFLLARLLNSTAVGLWVMAQSLTEAPNRLSTAIINQVSLPLFSRLQQDRQALAASFLKISKYLSLISLPIQIGLALVAADLIPIVLSPKWGDMVVPFQILCLESAVLLSTLTCGPLLTACGRARLLFSRSLLSFTSLVSATLIGAHFGLVGVAVARLLVTVPLRLTLLFPALRQLDLRPSAYARGLASPLCATTLMTCSVLLVQHTWPPAALSLESLVLQVAVGALTYLGALLLIDRTVGSEIKGIARDLWSPSHAEEAP